MYCTILSFMNNTFHVGLSTSLVITMGPVAMIDRAFLPGCHRKHGPGSRRAPPRWQGEARWRDGTLSIATVPIRHVFVIYLESFVQKLQVRVVLIYIIVNSILSVLRTEILLLLFIILFSILLVIRVFAPFVPIVTVVVLAVIRLSDRGRP